MWNFSSSSVSFLPSAPPEIVAIARKKLMGSSFPWPHCPHVCGWRHPGKKYFDGNNEPIKFSSTSKYIQFPSSPVRLWEHCSLITAPGETQFREESFAIIRDDGNSVYNIIRCLSTYAAVELSHYPNRSYVYSNTENRVENCFCEIKSSENSYFSWH